MSEPTMPSERVSRERREAIGKALHRAHCAAWDDIESADEEWADPVIQHEFMAQADAAIAAILPERHDAPGVSEQEAESLIHAYHDTFQALWRNPFNLENIDRAQAAHLALKDALTGSPDAEQCIHRIGAPACRKGLGCGCMRGEAPELPDAGRDPDAADAGGGANDG